MACEDQIRVSFRVIFWVLLLDNWQVRMENAFIQCYLQKVQCY